MGDGCGIESLLLANGWCRDFNTRELQANFFPEEDSDLQITGKTRHIKKRIKRAQTPAPGDFPLCLRSPIESAACLQLQG